MDKPIIKVQIKEHDVYTWYQEYVGEVLNVEEANETEYLTLNNASDTLGREINREIRYCHIKKEHCTLIQSVSVEGVVYTSDNGYYGYTAMVGDESLGEILQPYNGKKVRILIEEIE